MIRISDITRQLFVLVCTGAFHSWIIGNYHRVAQFQLFGHTTNLAGAATHYQIIDKKGRPALLGR